MAGVRRIKLRLFLFPPHPTFSLWRRLSPRDKVKTSEYLHYFHLKVDIVSDFSKICDRTKNVYSAL